MNKSLKRAILFLIILLLIISTIMMSILFYLKTINNNQEKENNSEELGGSLLDDYINIKDDTISKTAYFDINTCMAQYLNTLNINSSRYYGYNENGEYYFLVGQDEIKTNIYNLLSEVYIKKKNITIENIYDYVKAINEQTLYVPLEATILQNGDIQSFAIHGIIETIKLEVVDEIFAVVNIDKVNNVFSIEPIYGNYSSITEIKIEQLENKININESNKFSSISVSNETVVKDYINIYKRLALGSPEIIYNMLDKEYREKAFQTLEDFKAYIEEKREDIISIRVEEYNGNKMNEYVQYVCMDQNNNYYFFKEIAPFKYTVMLDNYTIPTEDFTETYNSSSEPEKVVLNIKRFFMGIDDKNYGYSYSVLSEAFKNNNYPTKNDFINYVKQNFFEENEIEYIKYEKENGLYIYKIKIKDATGKSAGEKELNMILKLKSGTDFEMSFGEN